MNKKKVKLLAVIISLIAVCFANLSPVSAFAASNGKKFLSKGKTPLAVTVSYYSDALSRGVAWTTMSATDGVLEVVPAESKESANWNDAVVIPATRKVEDSTYYTYTAYIENLTEEKYCYRVGSKDGTNYSQVGTFTVDQDQSEINFIYATDPQDYDEEGFSQWAKLVEASYQTMPEAQFFGMGGDIVNNSHDADSHDLDQWIYALELPKAQFIDSVFMPVSGNHDKLDETFCNRFAINYQGSRSRGGYYSFDYGNMHFVGLNTNESGDALNVQAQWLKQDLASTDKQWKIVMMHKGLISTGDHSNDSDVKAIREVMLPIMAEYEVDMVLQGHDHCYVRSVPYSYGKDENGNFYNGKTPNLNETLITEVVNGEKITYSVEPNGTFYMTANYAGRKSYPPVDYDKNLIYPAQNPYNGLYMSQQILMQTFTTVKIVGNTLQFNCYTFDGNKTTLYDTYNIKKDTQEEVERLVENLPEKESADLFDYHKVKQVKEEYQKLTANAVKNMDETLKAKIEDLISMFDPMVYEDAYTVACEIEDLGQVLPELSFIQKINSIKRKYADLTQTQKALISNYSTVAQKESEYKDRLFAKAVSDLAYQCANGGEIYAHEVYYAYDKLTETQKSYVNLHGVQRVEEGDLIIIPGKGLSPIGIVLIVVGAIAVVACASIVILKKKIKK